MREHLPYLKAKKLTRGQWSCIRRIIGRPRRFSSTFLEEERLSVQGKRRNLRFLQQFTDIDAETPDVSEHLEALLSCLPSSVNIPPQLRVGIKVCVRLYKPVRGLYSGIIQDVDTPQGSYGVWVENVIFSESSNCNAIDPNRPIGYKLVMEEEIFPLPGNCLSQSTPLSEIRNRFSMRSIMSDVVFPVHSQHESINGSLNAKEDGSGGNPMSINYSTALVSMRSNYESGL
ncbi:unnamed protein product [Protopolystoma xenopodis]|uniref:DIRP domain-containing protein n=1 Tax=Protopolystoma xenopodis TaxID=117903 RepID=A0A448WTP4_9PLAT|nr:unnamed protein product [Protopolystoma xenopodis]